MNTILAWFKSKNITAHSIAVAAVAIATLYTSDQGFRDFVIAAFQNHPKILANITLLVGVILKYSHSSSDAGTVAKAENIMAAPSAPTLDAIAAANPAAPPPITPKG